MYTNKFSLTFLSFFVVIFIAIGCLKDEEVASSSAPAAEKIESIETTNTDTTEAQVETRNGTGDLIFYRGSLSSDNYLMLNSTSRTNRTHTVYNKDKVSYIDFKPGSLPKANIGGVINAHYVISIVFKDNTTLTFKAFSKDSLSTFRYLPKGTNLLASTHPSKFVTWISSSSTAATVNEWRSNSYITLTYWSIYADNKFITQKLKEPLNRNSNQFMPPHSHN